MFEDKVIGKCFEPNMANKGKKSPIYFLWSQNEYKMILHKSQIYAALHFQKLGMKVRKFEPTQNKTIVLKEFMPEIKEEQISKKVVQVKEKQKKLKLP